MSMGVNSNFVARFQEEGTIWEGDEELQSQFFSMFLLNSQAKQDDAAIAIPVKRRMGIRITKEGVTGVL